MPNTDPPPEDDKPTNWKCEEGNPKAGDWVNLANWIENINSLEHNLVNHRMGWLLAKQTILFTVFLALLTLRSGFDKNEEALAKITEWSLEGIPIIGILVACAFGVSIHAARVKINDLERYRSRCTKILRRIFDEQIPDSGYDNPHKGRRHRKNQRWPRLAGASAPLTIACFVALLWAGIIFINSKYGLVLFRLKSATLTLTTQLTPVPDATALPTLKATPSPVPMLSKPIKTAAATPLPKPTTTP